MLALLCLSALKEEATGLRPVCSRVEALRGLAAWSSMAVTSRAMAVSGGGKDYAGATIAGEDFSNGQYANKDFSGVDAAGTNFKNSKLRGARFFKADVAGADFSGSDLTAASFEGANLDGTKLTGSVCEGSAFSQTLETVGDISQVDFTDAVIRQDINRRLCERSDAKGVNPTTGVSTRDSLFCPD
ncbi:hypothetical protein CTAYLR_001024 [Chrysophaeum taylorii]|uniref:Pentapeptide repeat protein n=1 Tax=Chrysophaeum taylorii TaxID=2483200 RepID=A0AAD7XLN3_9STRA|nr:hypothetical protein CTAYLR_001024 [Chrysophaeum taylorii]